MSDETIKVPDIGDVSDVEVIEVCVSPGDQVEKDETLIVLESDKASMEVPSPRAGKVASISVQVGNKVSQGDEILVMSGADEGAETPEKVEDQPPAQAEQQRAGNDHSDQPPTAAKSATGGVSLDVVVPDIGDAQGVEVIEIPVKVGDSVAQDDTLIVLESDKASMEIPAPQAGVVGAIHVELGDKVSQGNLIVTLETDAAEPLPQTAPAEEQAGAGESGAAVQQPVAPDPAPPQTGVAAELTLEVPDIGDAGAVEVIEVAVAVGDKVEVDDTIAVLESDKASMEVPATHAGTVKKVMLEVGQKVQQGTPMVMLETLSSQAPAAPASNNQAGVAHTEVREDTQVKPSSPAPVETTAGKSGELIYAGPAVRLLAREFGVDLSKVSPTGPRDRILKEDVQNFVKKALSSDMPATAQGSAIPAVPEVDFSQFGKVEKVPMSRVQKLTAAAMHRSWLNVPHVTHFDEADITDLEEFRTLKKSQAQERGLKLTPLPFLLKACAVALKEYPRFNVSLAPSGEELIQKFYYNIGIAMDTPAGLMVPVIREVDKKGIWELAEEAARLGVKGQEGKLSRDDMQGGCFTISSLGAIGGTGFTPIVNTPEVAILGVSKTLIKPAYLNHEFVPRSMLPLALSYDHRAINGVDAGRFMTFLTQVLSDIRKLVL